MKLDGDGLHAQNSVLSTETSGLIEHLLGLQLNSLPGLSDVMDTNKTGKYKLKSKVHTSSSRFQIV